MDLVRQASWGRGCDSKQNALKYANSKQEFVKPSSHSPSLLGLM